MSLLPPAVTYSPLGGTDIPRQSLVNADRPVCSAVAAFTAAANGTTLGGAARGLTPAQAAGSLLRHLETRGIPRHRAELWAGGIGQNTLADLVKPCDPELLQADFGVTLAGYQLRAVDRSTCAGTVMALGCGLGKTLASLAACRQARRTGLVQSNRVTVVAPVNAHGVWEPLRPAIEAMGFSWGGLVSIDLLHKYTAIAREGGCVIFDEVHKLGLCDARRTAAAHEVRRAFDYAVCLTGTLLHSGIEKSLSIVDLAIPGAAGFANRWSAGEYFGVLTRLDLPNGRTVTKLQKPEGDARERLNAWLAPYVTSISNRQPEIVDALGLPDQDVETVRLSTPWKSLTDLKVEAIRDAMERHPEDGVPDASSIAHAVARMGIAHKVDWLLEELSQHEEPAVVVGYYEDSLAFLREALDGADIPYVFVDGTVTGKKRAKAVADFQAGEVRLFVGQIDACGESVTLTRARLSYALEHSRKPESYDQFLARTRRRGQDRECAHTDVVANILQERVVDLLREGRAFDASVAEWQALRT